ncbi:MAG: hypothetical protein ACYC65_03925 [Candidatus Limnocylindrales bacterium]
MDQHPTRRAAPTDRPGRGLPHGLVAAAVAMLTVLTASVAPARAIEPSADAPMMLQNVQWQDLRANRHGICNGAFQVVLKNVSATSSLTSTVNYLNEAQKCGLKVVFHFTSTISRGTVYPARVARWVRAVKNHPSLAGYLSVKEPSWVGVTGWEIRSLYRAFKAADPNHPVYALFGDIPHFGDTVNQYTRGMADVVMVDWYPVETASRGCSRWRTSYVSTGPRWFAKVKKAVTTATPGTPIIAMLQTHKYLAPTCHKKQLPTKTLLWRQAREAITYGGVSGFAFHTWTNSNYQMDEVRNPTMVGWMKELSGQVRGGTFQ